MLGFVTEGFIVVSDLMLISILSVSVEALEMLCAKTADALALWDGDLMPDDLLRPLHLMYVFKK